MRVIRKNSFFFLCHYIATIFESKSNIVAFFMIIISILLLCISIFFHWKKNASIFPIIYFPALVLKLLLGIFLGIIYTYYYNNGDTFIVFQDAVKLSNIAKTDLSSYLDFITSKPYHYPEEIKNQLIASNSSTVFFTILISVVNLITNNNYWITSLYFSFFSFCGFWFLLKAIKITYPTTSYSFIIANLCIPSIAFWSSGVIKEAIALPTIYFSLGIALQAINNRILKFKHILLLSINLFILSQIKFYYFGSSLLFFTPLFLFIYLDKNQIDFNIKYLLGMLTVGVLGVYIVSSIEYHLDINQLPKSLYVNYQKLSLHENDPYAINLPYMSATWKGIFMSLPKALIDNFLYPNFYTQRHFFDIIVSLENISLLTLIVGNVFLFLNFEITISKNKYFIVLLLSLYSLVTIAFITIASPNLGALSRYKIGASVFLYYLLLINFETKYLKDTDL